MMRFEPKSSGVINDRSVNFAITNDQRRPQFLSTKIFLIEIGKATNDETSLELAFKRPIF